MHKSELKVDNKFNGALFDDHLYVKKLKRAYKNLAKRSIIKHWAEKKIQRLLAKEGVIVNGHESCDIHVKDRRFYSRVLTQGSLGLGESYMDGWWDCPHLDEFFAKILKGDIQVQVKMPLPVLLEKITAVLTNYSKSQAYYIGETHYDLGNTFYQAMLGRQLIYSCGYWKDADTLEDAQEAKMDLICRKIGLRKGERVLDIGCGCGGFMKYAAENYGVSAVGITVSREQQKHACHLCKGLPIDIRYADYHEINETFDHIVSIGMFEHVGYKNYREFMKIVHHALRDDGLFLLHTIGLSKNYIGLDPWMSKYIFPNSKIPSLNELSNAIKDLFVMEDFHNFGADYDRTMMAWYHNFETNWPRFQSHLKGRFYRMWRYYLLSCAGSFRARKNQLWQIVLSKHGIEGGYQSMR